MTADEREALLLASFAVRSAGAVRRHAEPLHRYRSAFQRDRDRIVHSAAFRRLAQKTQVFTGDGHGYHRTRLTHTMEVASIARTLARALRLNEDLVEALALLHDIGHPPFGHAGEDVLDAKLEGVGGFNHNAQALRIVERLEQRYPNFPGLNLTTDVLDGQRRRAAGGKRHGPGATLEAQVVEAADSIAYNAHDADDALEIGLLEFKDLLDAELWASAAEAVDHRHSALDTHQRRRAVVHELLDVQVGDLLNATQRRLTEAGFDSPDDARAAPPVVGVSAAMQVRKRQLEALLFERVYRHPRLLERRDQVKQTLGNAFDELVRKHDMLPEPYASVAQDEGAARGVADILANLTDDAVLSIKRFDHGAEHGRDFLDV
ncbi:Deoxyguanosinetriphosphate triphosphohydrolase [Pirellulimonas nuda]|uniref:Deoxyguanosinetriphosphate triphosphohydrolase-like protein n=1 Tax=Pirellulimonas nuda TaxID=2528009 RepID=A0A518DI49_9BACT|nr:dNTP triphosphohydrolase [Pirellulimonas nuda]QDU91072.1 Deoxyguanosinetriphosphate triphosphohydrolase [Pirellulimonas nuda]